MDGGFLNFQYIVKAPLTENTLIQEGWQVTQHSRVTYLKEKEIRETATTNRSKPLKAERRKAPLWRIKPYDITFRQISTVNTDVKKMSK